MDSEDPYRHIAVRGEVVGVTVDGEVVGVTVDGEVVGVTVDGAVEHVDAFDWHYTNVETCPNHGE